MRSTFVLRGLAVLLLSGATLSALSAKPPPLKLLGEAASEAAAVRSTVKIPPKTKSKNVVGGEAIKFVAGDKSFTWNFDVPATIIHST